MPQPLLGARLEHWGDARWGSVARGGSTCAQDHRAHRELGWSHAGEEAGLQAVQTTGPASVSGGSPRAAGVTRERSWAHGLTHRLALLPEGELRKA